MLSHVYQFNTQFELVSRIITSISFKMNASRKIKYALLRNKAEERSQEMLSCCVTYPSNKTKQSAYCMSISYALILHSAFKLSC